MREYIICDVTFCREGIIRSRAGHQPPRRGMIAAPVFIYMYAESVHAACLLRGMRASKREHEFVVTHARSERETTHGDRKTRPETTCIPKPHYLSRTQRPLYGVWSWMMVLGCVSRIFELFERTKMSLLLSAT